MSKPASSGDGSKKIAKCSQLRSMCFTVLALFGVFGGMSALFVGLVFVVVHGLLSGDVILNRAGTGLLIAAIPMILIGSICADEIERKK